MTGDSTSNVFERILHAIDYGKLSYEETERRLQKIIDSESNQLDHPADAKLLEACYSLLLQLHKHGKVSFESHHASNWKAIQRRLSVQEPKHRSWRAVAFAAAAVVALFCMAFPAIRWFHTTSTPDEQQYTIQGHEITAQMISTALAEHQSHEQFVLNTLAEVEALVGFLPRIPEMLNSGEKAIRYEVFFYPEELQITACYAKEKNSLNQLLYMIDYYTDMENAYASIEQASIGSNTMINQHSIYLSSNSDYTVACWLENCSVHTLSIENTVPNVNTILQQFVEGE